MKLFLVQHGDALDKATDPERPLSAKGQQDVKCMAGVLARAGIQIDVILHSGKLRAQQTAQLLAGTLLTSGKIDATSGISPNDDVSTFASKLTGRSQDSLLVGHLPFMAKLVALLLTGDSGRDIVSFQPGSVVCLERIENDGWRLNYMLRPELFNTAD